MHTKHRCVTVDHVVRTPSCVGTNNLDSSVVNLEVKTIFDHLKYIVVSCDQLVIVQHVGFYLNNTPTLCHFYYAIIDLQCVMGQNIGDLYCVTNIKFCIDRHCVISVMTWI